MTNSICNITFWALAAGSTHRYQLNVGPNASGTVTELRFNGINAADLQMRLVEPVRPRGPGLS
ncbi:MAG: hypothetical protein ACOCXZ_00115 [Chloroflexota bacterium]